MDQPYKDQEQLAPPAEEPACAPAAQPQNGSGQIPSAAEPQEAVPGAPPQQPSLASGPVAEGGGQRGASRASENAGWMTSLQSLAVTVVIAVFVITFIVQAFQIPSESMENTLLIGDYLLVDKVHYASGGMFGRILPYSKIRRGDIIVFRYPVHPEQHFVKRVIGLPGDHVHLLNRRVYVNDQPLDEKYVIYKSSMNDVYRDDFPALDYLSGNVEARWWLEMRRLVQNGELVVPAGQYFVLGDNRDESLDSRYWGFVPRDNVVGRPLVIYWSIRGLGDRYPTAQPPGDKLGRLAYVLSHVFEETRWDRMLKTVH